ncbi:hypothetical protein NGM37_21400, partial [Streptomyces sp. TRM76130]|nr:hypothetical protein [Streptomyces sp. TRM76130]
MATFVGEANVVPAVVVDVGVGTFAVRAPTLGPDTVLDIAHATAAVSPSRGDRISVVFRPEWVRVSRETGPLPTRLDP